MSVCKQYYYNPTIVVLLLVVLYWSSVNGRRVILSATSQWIINMEGWENVINIVLIKTSFVYIVSLMSKHLNRDCSIGDTHILWQALHSYLKSVIKTLVTMLSLEMHHI